MAETPEILELKFAGGGVSPETVKPSEIAHLIENFERIVLLQAKAMEPGIDTDEVLVAFHKLDDKSLDLIFKTVKVRQIILNSYLLIASSFATGDYSQIHRSAIGPLKDIVKFSKRHNCEGSFKHNDAVISTFNPESEIEYNLQNTVKGQTTIYGKIIRIGGEEPKIHFRINEEEKLIFDVDEQQAKKLSPKLYEFIGLTGTATWNSINLTIDNFKIDAIINVDTSKPYSDTFSELKGIIGKYWDEIEDIDSYIN